jgi:hypothetical protein
MLATVEAQLAAKDKLAPHRPIIVIIRNVRTLMELFRFQASVILANAEQHLANLDKPAPHRPIRVPI